LLHVTTAAAADRFDDYRMPRRPERPAIGP